MEAVFVTYFLVSPSIQIIFLLAIHYYSLQGDTFSVTINYSHSVWKLYFF